jgi:hypothetical protein
LGQGESPIGERGSPEGEVVKRTGQDIVADSGLEVIEDKILSLKSLKRLWKEVLDLVPFFKSPKRE